jgi:hypothetical protein
VWCGIVDGVVMSDVVAKLKLLYKNVEHLSWSGVGLYLIENSSGGMQSDKNLVLVTKNDTVEMSVSFSSFEFRNQSNCWDCLFLSSANYCGRRQNLIVFITEYDFKYMSLSGKYVIQDVEVLQSNLCVFKYYSVTDSTRTPCKSFIFIYDNECENMRRYMKIVDSYRRVFAFGKWCVKCSVGEKKCLVYFKDSENIVETQEFDNVSGIFSTIDNLKLITLLDYKPFYGEVVGGENSAGYAVLCGFDTDPKDMLLCWRISILKLGERITGYVKAYLLNADFEKTDNFVNVMVVDKISTKPINTFKVCGVDGFDDYTEEIRYNNSFGIAEGDDTHLRRYYQDE